MSKKIRQIDLPHILLRVPQKDKTRFQKAAEKSRMSFNTWAIITLVGAADAVLGKPKARKPVGSSQDGEGSGTLTESRGEATA